MWDVGFTSEIGKSGEFSLERCHLNERLEGCEDLSHVDIWGRVFQEEEQLIQRPHGRESKEVSCLEQRQQDKE